MNLINLYHLLEHAGMDENAGIHIERVTGDDQFSFYVAEVFPGTWLKSHYHTKGIELYQILQGAGIMRIGRRTGETAVWEEEFTVESGDCFTIPEGMVHQLGNMTGERLIAGITCPPSHLGDDRFFLV